MADDRGVVGLWEVSDAEDVGDVEPDDDSERGTKGGKSVGPCRRA